MAGVQPDDNLRNELIQLCVKEIGPIAKPDIIQWVPDYQKPVLKKLCVEYYAK